MSPTAIAALTVDAAGTLLHPALPVADVYAQHAARLGVVTSADAVGPKLRDALRRHRGLRVGDPSWRAYWGAVVATATGSRAGALAEELYEHYRGGDAWRIATAAVRCIVAVRGRGIKVGLISNWDSRLHDTLAELRLTELFDAVIVSADHGCEKPDARIFGIALAQLRVEPSRWLHVGDDLDADIAGARRVGGHALHMPEDVADFTALEHLVCRG